MPALRPLQGLVFRLSFVVLVLASLISVPRLALAANAVVGTGNPDSCTDTTFDTAFYTVQSSGGGIITFNCGAAPHTIIFSTQKPVSANTELRGGGRITLSGANATSLFQVYFGQTLTLDRIVLTRGYGQAGAIENFGRLVVQNSLLTNNASTSSGGAITTYGELTVTNSTISGNSASQTGGGILADGGTAMINASSFADNVAGDAGGAIRATNAVSATIDASRFTGNKVTSTFAQGGAVRAEGEMRIVESTFTLNGSSRGGALSVGDGSATVMRSTMTRNWAAYGGAIRQEGGDLKLTDVTLMGNGFGPTGVRVTTGGGAVSWGAGTATLDRVTMSGNWASYGGGFDHAAGTTALTNVTISGNAAVGSGAVDQDGGSVGLTNVTIAGNTALFNAGGVGNRGGTLTMKNTLLSGNFKSDNGQKWNCSKPVEGATFSLSSDNTCALGIGRDNLALTLRPLVNNGGYTPTHLLAKGSPGSDTGTGLGCPTTDQRGVSRPQAAACDVGAVEMRLEDFTLHVYLPATTR